LDVQRDLRHKLRAAKKTRNYQKEGHVIGPRAQSFLMAVALSLLSGCSSLLYHPTDIFYANPSHYNVTPKEVVIESSGGTKLAAWYFSSHQDHPETPPKAVLVFFHGNGENMTSHYQSLVWILKHGYDFLIFDYRGYGVSEGKPSPEMTVEDGKAAIRWTSQYWKNQHKDVPLVVFGQSLGGAIGLRSAIEVKSEIPIKLIVADSTFVSYEEAGQKLLANHWFTWIFQPLPYLVLSDKYAPGDRVSELSPIPLVVIHGDHDQILNYELGKEVYAKAREPKEFWPVPGGTHIDGMRRKDPSIRDKLLAKLDEITGSSN
jgi:fermentation-respiration switch protein FrsA (DUF1100 family)